MAIMKKEDYPEFDEALLKLSGTEVVRPVQTTPCHEFRFRDFCLENGLSCYCPLRRAWKVHNLNVKGRAYNYSKEVLRPMFPSYVFVKTPLENLRKLFGTKLIIRILPVTDQPAFMEEVKLVRKVELVGFRQELEFHDDIAVGDHFMIQSGIWEGVSGWLVCRDGKFKWTVQFEFVNQLVTTTIDPSKFKMERLG